MKWLNLMGAHLRGLFRREAVLKDIEEEMRLHVDMETQTNIEHGMRPEDARRAALRSFGNLGRIKELGYEIRGGGLVDTLWQDIHYGARMLVKSPSFTSIAVITLALGIGATTAIFSVVNAVLLRPLPYQDSDRIVQVWSTNPHTIRWGDWVSYPNFRDWRKQNRVFDDMAVYRSWLVNLTGSDRPEVLFVLLSSSNLFSVLGSQPMLGRPFLPEEDEPGRNRVVIVSYGLWQRRYGSDPALVGKTVTIEQGSYTVVGVMPPRFSFPEAESAFKACDAWIPLGPDPFQNDRGSNNYRVVARLAPGVSVEEAQANMEGIAGRLATAYAENRDLGVRVAGLRDNVAKEVRPALLMLFGAIGLVLLIACTNVASLLLARGAARRREVATRHALGASRWRLTRQLLTESMLLTVVGGLLGLFVAFQGVKLLTDLAPNMPRLQETTIDPRVLVFTVLVSAVTGIVFGIVPALQASKVDLQETLKESGSRSTPGSARARTRSGLVVAETALAMTLLIGAGLLIRSFVRLQNVDPGFDPTNVLTAYVALPASKYPEPRRQVGFFREVVDRIGALPGVEAASGANSVPLLANNSGGVQIEGRPEPRPGGVGVEAEKPSITPDYFRVMKIPLLRGRVFTWADDQSSPPVAVISEAAAQLYWPGEDPIGKRVSLNGDGAHPQWQQVVGVVADVRHDGLDIKPRPYVYTPLPQSPSPFMVLAVSTHQEPSTLTDAVRRQVIAVDKDQPLFEVETLGQVVSRSVAGRRFQVVLLAIFAVVALALAAVGLYGVISYSIAQRTHEIGIRMALGAQTQQVMRLVLAQGLKLALIGAILGSVTSLALASLITSLLFGVSASDPLTFGLVALLLTIVASLACWMPARRATKVDPTVALRYE